MTEQNDKLFQMAANGEFVLFLGAGAIYGSTIGANHSQALMGNDLRDKLHALFFPD